MVSQVNSHTNATRIGWHLWEIDLRFAHGLPHLVEWEAGADAVSLRLENPVEPVEVDHSIEVE